MDFYKILPAFSYIFHPIFIPLYGFFTFLYISNSEWNHAAVLVVLIQITILTVLLPFSLYYLLKSTGKIEKFTEASLHERKLPVLFQLLLLTCLLIFSGFLEQVPLLYYFILGGIIAGCIIYLLLWLKYKASLHLTGMSSLLFFALGCSIYFNNLQISLLAILIVLIGNVSSSRLYMKSHTVHELITGFGIGAFSQILLFYFYL